MLTFINVTSLSSATASRTGATARHGPHHSAQKSTITRPSAATSASSYVCSVRLCVITMPPLLRARSKRRGFRGALAIAGGRPLSEARKALLDLPEQLARSSEHAVTITRRGQPVLAVLPWEFYESIVETLEILGDPELVATLRASLGISSAGDSSATRRPKSASAHE